MRRENGFNRRTKVKHLVRGLYLMLVMTLFAVHAEANYVFTQIDVPGSFFTEASAINNAGQILGTSGDGLGNNQTFLLNAGVFTTISVPIDSFSPAGINNAGQIVGRIGVVHSFLADGGVVTPINVPGSIFTGANAINDGSTIAGTFTDSTSHGFLLVSGSFTTVNVPGSSATEVNGLNNVGQFVGDFIDPMGDHGFLADASGFTAIDIPGSFFVAAMGINDVGDIVGDYTNLTGLHGFVLSGGVLTTLDFPAGPGAPNITWAAGINNAGEVIGWYYDSNFDAHGYAATLQAATVPEPSTLALFVGGLAVLLRLGLKRRFMKV